MDSEPIWHLDLPQFKSAAGGANLTRLNHDVQQLLVRVLFLGGITADHGVATKQNGLFGPTVSVRRPQESGWMPKVRVKLANLRD